MKSWMLLTALLCSTPAVADGEWTHYGNPFTVTDTPVTSVDFLAAPEKYDGKTLMVEGRIADVCQKAGCWLVLAEGDKAHR